MRSLSILGIALLGVVAHAQFDDKNLDTLGPGAETPVRSHARGETDMGEPISADKAAAQRAKNSKVKVVYEGFVPNKVEETGTPTTLQNNLVIKTELDYAALGKKVRTERTVFMPEENKDWVSLTRPRDSVVMLGHLISRSPEKIKMEYIIVDTSRDDDQVISPPPLEAPVGQKMIVNLDGAREKITVSLQTQWRKI